MGGGKSSSSQSSVLSALAGPLFKMGQQRFNTTQPVLQQLSGQIQQALQTGGAPQAQIPMISRSMDATRQASSQGMEQARQNVARGSEAGSSFGQNILNELGIQEQQTAANVGPNVAQQFMGMAPQVGLDVGGFGPMERAAGLDVTTKSQYTPSFWDLFASMQGMGQQAGTAGAMATGTP